MQAKTQSNFYNPSSKRTLSLPDAIDKLNFNSPRKPTKNYFLSPSRPAGERQKTLLPISITHSTSNSISNLPNINTISSARSYTRLVKISNNDGTMVYNLTRKEDGTLGEFRPLKTANTIRAPRKETPRNNEEKVPLKKVTSIHAPTPGVELSAAPSKPEAFSLAPRNDFFFNIVNKMLDDQQRMLSEEKERARQEQNWFKEVGKGKGKTKVQISNIKKRLSIDLKVLKPDEREIILEYEHEILGNYTSSENRPRVISTRMQKKLEYMQRLRLNLLDEENRQFLIKMVQARKAIKQFLLEKDLEKVMNKLTEVLNLTIEADDMHLFLETLHLISDTYYDFGELDNALFVFNQLRIACELCNNTSKKIVAYTGMAEACKRLGHFSQALVFLKRALQFAWYNKETTKECQIYDLLGIIYYTQGEIEKANYYHERCVDSQIEEGSSVLLKLSNRDIVDYIKYNHNDFTSIEPTFFTRMSITYRPRRFKAFNAKAKKEKLRNFLHAEGQDEGKNFLQVEAQIHRATIFLENLTLKTQQSHASSFFSNDPFKVVGTQMPALSQLDTILAEPDFDRNITSPRTFYNTAEDKNAEGQIAKPATKVENKLPGDRKGDKYLMRRVKISGAQYHEQKKDRETYSLKQIFKEKDLTFKNVEDRVELRLHKADEAFTFEDLKKKFKAQYTAHPVNSKMFMGHLTPNRTTYGFLNVIEVKPARCNNFFDTALEHFVNKGLNH